MNNRNNNSNANNRNNFNNNGRFLRITLLTAKISLIHMKTYKNLWTELCSQDNLFLAYRKARKHKTKKQYVVDFEKNLLGNLALLRRDLLSGAYAPKPLVHFIIHEPKTRRISKSDFRDRIVHHALCHIIEPIFEKSFICDSFANRIGKGTLNAIKRFDYFKRKASKNNASSCYALKADIKKYFDTVSHAILLKIIGTRICDKNVLLLAQKIIENCDLHQQGKGMPLGNLTSQFFANVYLNELDQFVKHKLKARYYLRYVDDFIILHANKTILSNWNTKIDVFLKENLEVCLHTEKSKIIRLGERLNFLGFRIFYAHKLLKKSNIKNFHLKYAFLRKEYALQRISYDKIYNSLEGWFAYAKNANTHKLRRKIAEQTEIAFPNELSAKEIDRLCKL